MVTHEVPGNGIFGERDGAGYKSQDPVDRPERASGQRPEEEGDPCRELQIK